MHNYDNLLLVATALGSGWAPLRVLHLRGWWRVKMRSNKGRCEVVDIARREVLP